MGARVPGHRDLVGNQCVDEAAGEAIQLNQSGAVCMGEGGGRQFVGKRLVFERVCRKGLLLSVKHMMPSVAGEFKTSKWRIRFVKSSVPGSPQVAARQQQQQIDITHTHSSEAFYCAKASLGF